MPPGFIFIFVLLSVFAPSLPSPLAAERARWLEAMMGLSGEPEIYVGQAPLDLESSGDLPGGLEGSGDQPAMVETDPDNDLNAILIAIDNRTSAQSFVMESSSLSSSLSSSIISSITEASASEYDGFDSMSLDNNDVPDKPEGEYEGGNELGVGGDANDGGKFDKENEIDNDILSDKDADSNAIPDAFKNGAYAETGPETDMTVNQIVPRVKVNHKQDENRPYAKDTALEGRQSKISGEGNKPPEVLKYTAVIGVVMVAVAVGMGALLSALGLGAARLVKRIRRGPSVEEA